MNVRAAGERAANQRKTSLFGASVVTLFATLNSVLAARADVNTTWMLGVIVMWFAAGFSWSVYFGYRSTERSLAAFEDETRNDV
jgi:hypothetical protein